MSDLSARFYFSSQDDLLFLKQVLTDRPFLSNYGESEIAWISCIEKAQAAGLRTDHRCVRDRLKLLLRKLNNGQLSRLKNFSTQEEFEEKVQLLTELNELYKEKEKAKCEKKAKESYSKNTATEHRDNAMEIYKNNSWHDENSLEAIIYHSSERQKNITSINTCKKQLQSTQIRGKKLRTEKFISFVRKMENENKNLKSKAMQLKEMEIQCANEKLLFERTKFEFEVQKDTERGKYRSEKFEFEVQKDTERRKYRSEKLKFEQAILELEQEKKLYRNENLRLINAKFEFDQYCFQLDKARLQYEMKRDNIEL
jgi:hypothetical protein